VVSRGKLPRPDWVPIDDRGYPPADVSDLVKARQLQDLLWRLEVLCMTLRKPTTLQDRNGSSSHAVSPGQLLAPFSSIWEFLTATSWEDGTSRIPGTLSLKLWSGALQVTLTDPSTGTYCCRSAATLDDVLLALEVALQDDTANWRKSSYAKTSRK